LAHDHGAFLEPLTRKSHCETADEEGTRPDAPLTITELLERKEFAAWRITWASSKTTGLFIGRKRWLVIVGRKGKEGLRQKARRMRRLYGETLTQRRPAR